MYRNVCAVHECYNCQLLLAVHEYVEPVTSTKPRVVDHPVCHLKTLRFALQLYALSSNTNPVFQCR
jgi:predicted NAD/FAD-binding protein